MISIAFILASVLAAANVVRLEYPGGGRDLGAARKEPMPAIVDAAEYVRAKVVCSVDPASGKVREFTLRLTRYNQGGPNTGRAFGGMMNRHVDFDTAEKRDLGNGRWELSVPLDCGDLIGVIYKDTWGTYLNNQMRESGHRASDRGNYLDFEPLGPLPTFRHPLGDRRADPDPKKKSAITVHSVELVKAPVEMIPETLQPGNVFHNDEKPEMNVKVWVKGEKARPYRLQWEMFDAEDRPCGIFSEQIVSNATVHLDLRPSPLVRAARQGHAHRGYRRRTLRQLDLGRQPLYVEGHRLRRGALLQGGASPLLLTERRPYVQTIRFKEISVR